ncbi:hypothetical protein HK405_001305, partial [Cladochytrium tenue]
PGVDDRPAAVHAPDGALVHNYLDLAVVYVVMSIVDAFPHGLEPGYAGTSVEYATMSIYEPAVIALVTFLFFGTVRCSRSW